MGARQRYHRLVLPVPGLFAQIDTESEGGANGETHVLWWTREQFTLFVSLTALCAIIFGCLWIWQRRVLAGPWSKVPAKENLAKKGSLKYGSLNSVSITVEPHHVLHDLAELPVFITPTVTATVSSEICKASGSWCPLSEDHFPRANLEFQSVLGMGWFGRVLEAKASGIKKCVPSVKVVARKLRNHSTPENLNDFLSEASMYRKAKKDGFQNVLKLMGFCCWNEIPYILIFEYFPLGDLKSYLKAHGKKSTKLSLTRMIIDIIHGVKWMEQAGFVHGELAARNCLVANSAGKVVIGDYGVSLQNHKMDYYWCATSGCAVPIRWAAPETISFEHGDNAEVEVIKPLEQTRESMTWSLGVLIWEIFQLGKMPYDSLSNEEVIRRVIQEKSFLLECPKLAFVNEATKSKIYQLLVECWNSVPSLRPSLDTIELIFATNS